MLLSLVLVDPLTWFLGSLHIHVIKCWFSSSTKPKVYKPCKIITHFFLSSTQPSCFPAVPLPTSMLSMRDYTSMQVWPRFRLTDNAQCYQLSCSSTCVITDLAGVRMDGVFLALSSLLSSFKTIRLRQSQEAEARGVVSNPGCWGVWGINTARATGDKFSIPSLNGKSHLLWAAWNYTGQN